MEEEKGEERKKRKTRKIWSKKVRVGKNYGEKGEQEECDNQRYKSK